MRIPLSPILVLMVVASLSATSSFAPAEDKETHADISGKPDLKAKADKLKATVVTPHLEQEIPTGTNVLWCNTFQLAWNDLCDLTGGPIDMKSPPTMVPILNKKTAAKEDLDRDSYVSMAGLVKDGIYDKIRNELERKFKGQANPELLDTMQQRDSLARIESNAVAYAYLFKELPFQWSFDRFHTCLDFKEHTVESFGFFNELILNSPEIQAKMASQVSVLDYKNDDDLIIELKTQAKDDRLILAKVPPQKSLSDTISMVEKRIVEAKPTAIILNEILLIPVLNFDILREYTELYNNPVRTADDKFNGTAIAFCGQTIRFRLDERGAVLKSAELVVRKGASPRAFRFDAPFLILLKRSDAKRPYFALWVGNAELLVPAPVDACSAAIKAVRAQPGYTTTYKASICKTRSNPFEQVGTAVRRGDLLYREGRREEKGPVSVRLFRIKDRVAILDPRTEDEPADKQEWSTAEQVGNLDLGKGLEDPDVAMDFLLDSMAGATVGTGTEMAGGVPCRTYVLALDNQKLAQKVRQQYESATDLDWEKAEVSAKVLVGGEPALPRRFRISGVLPTKNRPDESVTLSIEVEVTSYGSATVPDVPPAAKTILDK